MVNTVCRMHTLFYGESMFGYVTSNRDEMKIRDFKRYLSYYCGLCHALGSRYGKAAQLTLTYDMTFLVILLNGLYEEPLKSERRRCMVHPAEKQDMLSNRITDYAADMSMLLTYYKLMDDIRDEGSVKSKMFAAQIRKNVRKIEKNYPRQAEAVAKNCRLLMEAEEKGNYDLDVVAGYTGNLTAEVFLMEEKDPWASEIRHLGFYLGKFVYLLDAFDDLAKDIKKGAYNPWIPESGRKDFEALVENTLTMMISECAKAFERLPIIQDIDILRNVIYSGVWVRYGEIIHERQEKGEGHA